MVGAGFRRLTVSFGPMWANWPAQAEWDPALFDENWAFIQDVRPLVKEYGPPETRIDLMNEAPGSRTWEPVDSYIVRM